MTEMKGARFANIPKPFCYLNVFEHPPAFCPSTRHMKEIGKATREQIEGELGEVARVSSVVECLTYG